MRRKGSFGKKVGGENEVLRAASGSIQTSCQGHREYRFWIKACIYHKLGLSLNFLLSIFCSFPRREEDLNTPIPDGSAFEVT